MKEETKAKEALETARVNAELAASKAKAKRAVEAGGSIQVKKNVKYK